GGLVGGGLVAVRLGRGVVTLVWCRLGRLGRGVTLLAALAAGRGQSEGSAQCQQHRESFHRPFSLRGFARLAATSAVVVPVAFAFLGWPVALVAPGSSPFQSLPISGDGSRRTDEVGV